MYPCKAVRACSASDYSAERSKKFEMRSGGLYHNCKLVLPGESDVRVILKKHCIYNRPKLMHLELELLLNLVHCLVVARLILFDRQN